MKKILIPFLISILIACSTNETSMAQQDPQLQPPTSEVMRDSIINEHLKNGAWKKGIYSREWQEEIDKGLAKDSTIAYLWQQKAMPLFKQGKYELGMDYIDQAVKYDRQEYQEYRAFIKCIFAKTYRAAILDFEDCRQRNGNSYVMDHSYNFYIALCKLQLNEFEEAETLLTADINSQTNDKGEDWAHPIELFYLGISQYEQKKYEEALKSFDRALTLYPQFSDAQYYKAYSLGRAGQVEEAKKLLVEAKANGQAGYTINEDNVLYERYPYQVRWRK